MNTQLLLAVFCIFQVAIGQNLLDPVANIKQSIASTQAKLQNFIGIMNNAKASFANGSAASIQQLEQQRQQLISDLSNSAGNKSAACVQAAQDSINNIVNYEETDVQSFTDQENDSFNPLADKITDTFHAQDKLQNDTAQKLQSCSSYTSLLQYACNSAVLLDFAPKEAALNLVIDAEILAVKAAQVKSVVDLQNENQKVQSDLAAKVKAAKAKLSQCQ